MKLSAVVRKYKTYRKIALYHGERKALRALLEFASGAPISYSASPPPLHFLPKSSGGRQVNRFYNFVTEREPILGNQREVLEGAVNWVVPDFGKGSGGHLNIFRFVKGLEDRGFKCIITIDGPTQRKSAAACKAEIRSNYVGINSDVYIGVHTAPITGQAFATSWTTAYTVRRLPDSVKKYYFVQDFEPQFYPMGSEYIFAENTYRFGFHGIAAGQWLSKKLLSDYGMSCDHIGFSYDRSLYHWDGVERQRVTKRIFCYTRPPTVRRGLELSLKALELACARDPEIEVVFAGWDMSEYDIPFRHQNLGHLRLEDLNEVFSSCSLALILSLTNASLLPLEAMACGCPVVSNDGPNVEWLLNHHVASLVRAEPSAIADEISQLIGDPAALAAKARTGWAYASQTTWEAHMDELARVLATRDRQ